MERHSDITLRQLIDERLLWGAVALVLLYTAALGYWVVKVQAFEAFYDYSRDHEEWQMDHVVMVSLIFLMLCGLLVGGFATLFARRLVAVTRAQRRAERRMQELQQQAAMGSMLGGMAHHINNHLQPVILLTRMVQDNLPPDSDDQKDLAVALQAAQNASEVLQRVQKIAGTHAESSGTCAAASSVQSALAKAGAGIPAHMQMNIHIHQTSGQLRMSRSELDTVVGHLVRNALDSMTPQGGSMQVELSPLPQTGQCVLRVADSGCGMTTEQLDRVFDPFYTTKPQGQGRGRKCGWYCLCCPPRRLGGRRFWCADDWGLTCLGLLLKQIGLQEVPCRPCEPLV